MTALAAEPTPLPGPTASAAPPLLQVDDLACRRGDRRLFGGLSFQVRVGQVLWVRGRNGCGKTSLLRLLAGLSSPDAGRVQRNGRLAYVAHHNALKDDLTVLESLQFLACLQGTPVDAAACTEALRRAGLHDRRRAPVRTLSQGQRRRVALARLFMQPSAALWILDEPFDALDSDSTQLLGSVLAGHAAGGGAVVLTSHLEQPLHDLAPTLLQLDQTAAR